MQKESRLSAIVEQLIHRSMQIVSVQVAIGELIPMSNEQIHTQWREGPLAHIVLNIHRVPAEQQCMVCFQKYHPNQKEVACPYCGANGAKVISGEEFFLEAIQEK